APGQTGRDAGRHSFAFAGEPEGEDDAARVQYPCGRAGLELRPGILERGPGASGMGHKVFGKGRPYGPRRIPGRAPRSWAGKGMGRPPRQVDRFVEGRTPLSPPRPPWPRHRAEIAGVPPSVL